MTKTFLVLTLLMTIASTNCRPTHGDEGMWLFNDLPIEHLKKNYDFEPTPQWSEKVMRSCVRFNVGGSASFVSSNGLVLTNHHVGRDTIFKLSSDEHNYLNDGFLAKTTAEELKAPDLELNQLLKITDVTATVNQSVTDTMDTGEATVARRAAIEAIESEATTQSGLRSNVITLYGGGRYHLYQFKKYTDVRLVWAPESAIAAFGGDADNFEYPRYCLDACIFRVYENDQPAQIEHFFNWSSGGAAENELVFVAGNPGRTSRIHTVAALKHQRDVRLPYVLDFIRRREILLQQFSLEGPGQARRAEEELLGFQNSRKALVGMLKGLQDPAVMHAKEASEADLLKKIKINPELKQYADAFETVAEIEATRAVKQGQSISLRTQLFSTAQTLVQMATEDQKPSADRLEEFQDAGRDSLEQQLFSPAPIYKDVERLILGDLISRTLESRGADDPLCQKILAGKSPEDRAAELVDGTQLEDPEFRKSLAAGGRDAIEASEDPMIQLALIVDTKVRADRKINDELDEAERQAYSQIAEAKFATQGTTTYPDATFSLRLAFGTVTGYTENGDFIPAWTVVQGAFERESARQGQKDFSLPQSWHDAKLNGTLNLETPFNFVCTTDIIGGNSGSPVINKDLEIVGLIFDGNIQSLTADYLYDDRQGRSVSVHSEIIGHSLRTVYGAEELADQLGK